MPFRVVAQGLGASFSGALLGIQGHIRTILGYPREGYDLRGTTEHPTNDKRYATNPA